MKNKNSNNVLELPYQVTQEAKYWGLQDVAKNANWKIIKYRNNRAFYVNKLQLKGHGHDFDKKLYIYIDCR